MVAAFRSDALLGNATVRRYLVRIRRKQIQQCAMEEQLVATDLERRQDSDVRQLHEIFGCGLALGNACFHEVLAVVERDVCSTALTTYSIQGSHRCSVVTSKRNSLHVND
jgi:hypothetical protein